MKLFTGRQEPERQPALAAVGCYYKVDRQSGRLLGYATLSAAEAAGLNSRYPDGEYISEAEWQRREREGRVR
jgi:hypothetical protein